MFNEKISPYWKSLIERLEGALTLSDNASPTVYEYLNALKIQIEFSQHENSVLRSETQDPLGAACHVVQRNSIKNRLVHQYKNRCLFLATGSCFAHCRYCFRKESEAMQLPFVNEEEITELCNYISMHNEIKEVLITGGDPVTASDKKLANLLEKIRKTKDSVIIRVATRAPIFAPERITSNVLSIFKAMKPLWVIPHINHVVEISKNYAPEARSAIENIINTGIPMQSQTVLLKGVNSDVKTLAELFNELAILGIKPGYLFQGDLAMGTSHFRLKIDNSISLFKALKHELSGISLPNFAVDLPQGQGKVDMMNLTEDQYHFLKALYG